MRLRHMLENRGDLDVIETRGDLHVEVTGATHDSRRVRTGDLFCCVVGEQADGHHFAPRAEEAGASALLVERWVASELPQVRVGSVRQAMGPLAATVHGEPSRHLTVIGVTGTNGKTTTTYLLEALARHAGRVAGVAGTVEIRIDGEPLPGGLTTPEAPDLQALFATMRARGVELVAMEVSSHALVRGRVEGTVFSTAVFTNLSRDHLDFHASMEDYFEAKASLFVPRRTRAAAVNVGDRYGADLARRCASQGLPTVTFCGPEEPIAGAPHPAVTATDVVLERDGTRLTLVAGDWGPARSIRSPLIGSFNVVNLLAAAAGALAAGLTLDEVVTGLSVPVAVPGRFEPVDRGQDFLVVVDYAHTPDALSHALRAARTVAGDRRVLVVFGCGGDRDRGKRPEMGRAAAELADLAYVTSDNPRSEEPGAIVDEVLAGVPAGAEVVVELDRRTAIRRAVDDARAGDVVVVAGKGHETGQVIGEVERPFDDRTVVAEELERRPCA